MMVLNFEINNIHYLYRASKPIKRVIKATSNHDNTKMPKTPRTQSNHLLLKTSYCKHIIVTLPGIKASYL